MLGSGFGVLRVWLTWIVFKRTLRNVSVPSLDLMAMDRQCWACWSHEICATPCKAGYKKNEDDAEDLHRALHLFEMLQTR